MRLVLDTNTALSGLLLDGPPRRLIEAAENRAISLCSSVVLLTELRNVLSRGRFIQSLARRGVDVATVFAYYMALVTIVAPAIITATILRDPSDDAVLATTVGAGADFIVSGDAHLLNLKSLQRIGIVTASIADRLRNPGG